MGRESQDDIYTHAEQVVTNRIEHLDKFDTTPYEVKLDPGNEAILSELIRAHFPLPENTEGYIRNDPLDIKNPIDVALTLHRLNTGVFEMNDDLRWRDSISKCVIVELRLRDMDLINMAIEKQLAVRNGFNPDYPEVSYEVLTNRQRALSQRCKDALMRQEFVEEVNEAFQDAGAPIRPSYVKRFKYNV